MKPRENDNKGMSRAVKSMPLQVPLYTPGTGNDSVPTVAAAVESWDVLDPTL